VKKNSQLLLIGKHGKKGNSKRGGLLHPEERPQEEGTTREKAIGEKKRWAATGAWEGRTT